MLLLLLLLLLSRGIVSSSPAARHAAFVLRHRIPLRIERESDLTGRRLHLRVDDVEEGRDDWPPHTEGAFYVLRRDRIEERRASGRAGGPAGEGRRGEGAGEQHGMRILCHARQTRRRRHRRQEEWEEEAGKGRQRTDRTLTGRRRRR